MKLATGLVGAAVVAAALTGCASSTDISNSPDAWSTHYVDGTRCIVMKPDSSTVTGMQIECDFGKDSG